MGLIASVIIITIQSLDDLIENKPNRFKAQLDKFTGVALSDITVFIAVTVKCMLWPIVAFLLIRKDVHKIFHKGK